MGGWGSGRWQIGKNTTSDYLALDLRQFNSYRLLKPGKSFDWNWACDGETVASIKLQIETDKIILNYKDKSLRYNCPPIEHTVQLEWTACTLGGRRAWLRCPASGCGRRVALLYSGGSGIFACRHCFKLAYSSQRESTGYRAMRRANRIRDSLGWEAGILNSWGDKPKGMHWRTFNRLNVKYDNYVYASLAGMLR